MDTARLVLEFPYVSEVPSNPQLILYKNLNFHDFFSILGIQTSLQIAILRYANKEFWRSNVFGTKRILK